ncbi:hypothetical protein P691DRAFT_810756 [Macrolepiota fuliginosa MF-IS2]|uniref:Uncharacterized protein n=1 Tax=Macrolepiota fuliginosa MF-IS2 TaxID=1400762 RepID=A0A9P6BYC1_9AGAR|nr:hypothetical protein P691DRAFT_810756 [Macrolepiota fuliginosa MF-IS2]
MEAASFRLPNNIPLGPSPHSRFKPVFLNQEGTRRSNTPARNSYTYPSLTRACNQAVY